MLYYFWHQIHTPTHYLAKLVLLFISLTKNKITLMTAKFGGLKSFFFCWFYFATAHLRTVRMTISCYHSVSVDLSLHELCIWFVSTKSL